MMYHLDQYFWYLQKYSQIIHHSDKAMNNKNGRRCKDGKTLKVCEQGREVNVGPKIKQTTSI